MEKLLKRKEVFNNKYFRFFLLASDDKFFKKKDSDLNWVNRLSKKFSKDTIYKTKQLNLQLELETRLEKEINGGEIRPGLDSKNSNFVNLKYFLSKLDSVSQEGYTQSLELIDLIQEITKQQLVLARVTKKFVNKLKIFNSKNVEMETIATANLTDTIKLSKMFDMIANTMQK